MSEALSKEELMSLALECYRNPATFVETFFPTIVTEPLGWFHRGLISLLTEHPQAVAEHEDFDKIRRNFIWSDGTPAFGPKRKPLGQRNLIMVPQGFGKTFLVGTVLPLHHQVYHETNFLLYCTNRSRAARSHLDSVKRERLTNERLNLVFGPIEIGKTGNTSPRSDFLVTASDQAIAVAGPDDSVRDLIFAAKRPGLILVDDIESHRDSDNQRNLIKDWFFNEICVLDAKIIYVASLAYANAIPHTLHRDPTWQIMEFGAITPSGEPLWEKYIDTTKLEAIRRSMALTGQGQLFDLRYFNRVSTEKVSDMTQILDKSRDKFIDLVMNSAGVDIEAIEAAMNAPPEEETEE